MTEQNPSGQRSSGRNGSPGKTAAERRMDAERGRMVARRDRRMRRARAALGYTYPIDKLHGDDRFTSDLVDEIAGILERHGFPPVQSGYDLARLLTALYRFLYRRRA